MKPDSETQDPMEAALRDLVAAASEVRRCGATPGAQWNALNSALIRARLILDTASTRSPQTPREGEVWLEAVEGLIERSSPLHVSTLQRLRAMANWADTLLPADGYIVVDRNTGLKAIEAARKRLPNPADA